MASESVLPNPGLTSGLLSRVALTCFEKMSFGTIFTITLTIAAPRKFISPGNLGHIYYYITNREIAQGHPMVPDFELVK